MGGRLPLIIVPTKYYSTPTEVFKKAGVSLVIWANHLIRGAVATMERIAQNIYENETLINIEDEIAPVKEIFRLQGAQELLEAEKRYFTQKNHTQAIVLAASQGKELNSLTENKPKVMLPIGGKPLLRRLIDELKKMEINNIHVVAGYKAESINIQGIKVIVNQDYETTGELASLICSEGIWEDDLIILYGDLLFRNYILRDLLEAKGDIVTVVDSAINNISCSGNPDYAYCSKSDDRFLFNPDVNLLKIDHNQDNASGRWLGMLKFNNQGKKWLDQAITELKKQPNFNQLGIPDLCNYLIGQGKEIKVIYINGHWLDLNSLEDLNKAEFFTHFN
jgi:phosphoenolpyruvate phosphomutase